MDNFNKAINDAAFIKAEINAVKAITRLVRRKYDERTDYTKSQKNRAKGVVREFATISKMVASKYGLSQDEFNNLARVSIFRKNAKYRIYDDFDLDLLKSGLIR